MYYNYTVIFDQQQQPHAVSSRQEKLMCIKEKIIIEHEHTMDFINDMPFNAGGKYGPGQEIYYALHRIRLWRWYCNNVGTHFRTQDANIIYRQKKEVLQRLCDILQIPSQGTKKDLIATLDRYTFTQEQINIIGF